MARVVIFGAGQAGRMAARWMGAGHTLAAYADNGPALWHTSLGGVPVLPPAEALALGPEEVWAAVLNRQAEAAIRRQLTELGYFGPVRSVGELRGWLDLRLAQIRLLAEQLERDRVPGAVAELGVYRGETAAELNRLFPGRPLYLFDTFQGFDPADLAEEEQAPRRDFSDGSLAEVQARLPHPEQARFFAGRFPATMPASLPSFALVCLDFDLFRPTYEALIRFLPRLAPGGLLLLHDYTSAQFPGVARAVRLAGRRLPLRVLPLCDLHGSALLWLEATASNEETHRAAAPGEGGKEPCRMAP